MHKHSEATEEKLVSPLVFGHSVYLVIIWYVKKLRKEARKGISNNHKIHSPFGIKQDYLNFQI